MAKSFAEAFQLAQASKAAAVTKKIAVLNSAAVQAVQQPLPDQDLWAQQAAKVKPLASQNDVGLTIGKVTTSPKPPDLVASSTQDIAVAGGMSNTPATEPVGQPKKRRKATLEEYYKRVARSKTEQARLNSSKPWYPNLPPIRSASLAKPTATTNSVTLTLEPDAKVVWDGTTSITAPLLTNDSSLGARTQLSHTPTSAREVVLGFDFGTSSAKVVIGDRGLKTAYAVPFRDAIGIDAYLLPARLHEANGSYSLHGGAQDFNDLKLALLASPHDVVLRCHVVGYLALAIREARGWLFTAHAEDYARTNIVWTVALGLPAEHASKDSLSNLFAHLGTAAWAVAGQTVISHDSCRKALNDVATRAIAIDVEVVVIPEIAAQVYGFVNSNRFDAKARNFFLIADIGAGTVDTCLFRVIPAKGGRWSFEIYAAAVEPNGVMNLHRHRIAWWQRHLPSNISGAKLCKELEGIKLGTENQTVIPTRYAGYLSGVTVQFTGKQVDPDKAFFETPLLSQIRGRTLYQAFKKRLLSKQDIVGIPFFLCGGGARLDFYRELGDSLRRFHGCSWLSTQKEELVKPDELRAEGVGRIDYDRLSVAYGLSMLNLADITTAEQLPELAPQPLAADWGEHYVDKDQC